MSGGVSVSHRANGPTAEHIDADQAADLAARAQQSVQTLTDAPPVVRAPTAVGPVFTDPGRELGAVTAATLSYCQDYGRLDIARNYLAGAASPP